MSYQTAQTIDEALAVLGANNVSLVAGATDWFPALGEGPAPQNVLDITRIPELHGITRDQHGWRIGATTRWSDVLAADLPICFDGLKSAAREVGSVQIQNTATVAGNICNASPAADGVPPLMALDAEVQVVATNSTRKMPLAQFITGARTTELRKNELVSALIIPDAPEKAGSSFLKLGSRKYLVISIAMASATIGLDNTGRINFARVVVGACSPVAQYLTSLQAALIGLTLPDLQKPGLVSDEHLAALSPITDTRSSADYRIEVVAELCQRAIIDSAGKVN